MDFEQMSYYLKCLPKIELHAHLNGSISSSAINEIKTALSGENYKPIDKENNGPKDDGRITSMEECFQIFDYIHGIISSKEALQLATKLVIRDFYDDNVVYLELRTTPKQINANNKQISRRQYLEYVLETIEECKSKYAIIVKLLVSIDRSQTPEIAEGIVEAAISMQSRYPDLVKGVDFSGNPRKGYFKDFLPALKIAKEHGLKLAIHCGEVENETEIDEMLNFGFQRCGHGVFLKNHHIEKCRTQGIAIECCLSSNRRCGIISSIKDSHFKRLYNNNNMVVLCTDDCGVFDTSLTKEFIQAYTAFDLDRRDINLLSQHAINSSFASQEEKCQLRKLINDYFEEGRIRD